VSRSILLRSPGRLAECDSCTARDARPNASYRVRHRIAEIGSPVFSGARPDSARWNPPQCKAARRIARTSAPGPRGSGRTRWAPARRECGRRWRARPGKNRAATGQRPQPTAGRAKPRHS